jgi:hypothetical protein
MITNNETILVAVLDQLKVKGIDYNILAKDIGAGTAKAAKGRWERCWTKLKESKGNNPAKSTGINKSPGKASKRSPAKVKKEESDEDTEVSDDLPVTPPPKRLPARKARVEKFEELLEATKDEDEQGMVEADDGGEFKIEIKV